MLLKNRLHDPPPQHPLSVSITTQTFSIVRRKEFSNLRKCGSLPCAKFGEGILWNNLK